jgi:hypothetical protein
MTKGLEVCNVCTTIAVYVNSLNAMFIMGPNMKLSELLSWHLCQEQKIEVSNPAKVFAYIVKLGKTYHCRWVKFDLKFFACVFSW